MTIERNRTSKMHGACRRTAFPSPGRGSPSSKSTTSPRPRRTTGTATPANRSALSSRREFADYLGVDLAAAVPHCTSALHLAMLALGIGPGDEVIVPESTWVATAPHRSSMSARPRSSPTSIPTPGACRPTRSQSAISAADQGDRHRRPLRRHARHGRRSGRVAGDGCRSSRTPPRRSASSWTDEPAGTLGDIGDVQLPRHEDADHRRGRHARHGPQRPVRPGVAPARPRPHAGELQFFVTDEIGFKYRMSSLQAAFGRAQLARLDELLGKKQQIFALVRGASRRTFRACG